MSTAFSKFKRLVHEAAIAHPASVSLSPPSRCPPSCAYVARSVGLYLFSDACPHSLRHPVHSAIANLSVRFRSLAVTPRGHMHCIVSSNMFKREDQSWGPLGRSKRHGLLLRAVVCIVEVPAQAKRNCVSRAVCCSARRVAVGGLGEGGGRFDVSAERWGHYKSVP